MGVFSPLSLHHLLSSNVAFVPPGLQAQTELYMHSYHPAATQPGLAGQ